MHSIVTIRVMRVFLYISALTCSRWACTNRSRQSRRAIMSSWSLEFKCVSEHYAARLGNVSMTVPATRFLSGPFCCCTFCAVGQAAHLIEELQYGTFHSLSHIFHPHVILTQIIYHRDSNKTLSFTTSHRLTDIMSSFPVQPQ